MSNNKEKNAEIIITSNYDHLLFIGGKGKEMHAMTQSDDIKEVVYMFRAAAKQELKMKGFSHAIKWGGIILGIAAGLTEDYSLNDEMKKIDEIINNITDKLHDKLESSEN